MALTALTETSEESSPAWGASGGGLTGGTEAAISSSFGPLPIRSGLVYGGGLSPPLKVSVQTTQKRFSRSYLFFAAIFRAGAAFFATALVAFLAGAALRATVFAATVVFFATMAFLGATFFLATAFLGAAFRVRVFFAAATLDFTLADLRAGALALAVVFFAAVFFGAAFLTTALAETVFFTLADLRAGALEALLAAFFVTFLVAIPTPFFKL